VKQTKLVKKVDVVLILLFSWDAVEGESENWFGVLVEAASKM